MVKGIDTFLGGRSRADGRGQQLRKMLKSGASKEERREFEAQKLRPDKLPEYTGPQPGKEATAPLYGRTVTIVFADTPSVSLFAKYFHVNKYVQQNVTNIDLLLALLHGLEDGSLAYDEEEKRITGV